jgi:hypothetical protein
LFLFAGNEGGSNESEKPQIKTELHPAGIQLCVYVLHANCFHLLLVSICFYLTLGHFSFKNWVALTVANLDARSFADQPVTQEQIEERLRTKGISEEDAKLYAAKLQGAKFATPRQLASLTKPELRELEFALGHQAVALEAFTEWMKEFSSTARGAVIRSIAVFTLSSPPLRLLFTSSLPPLYLLITRPLVTL